MPTITISGFDRGGLNSDLPQWDLQPNQLTTGENFRCENGAISSFGGSSDWGTHPASTDLGFIYYFETPSTSYWIHAGTVASTNVVYSWDGSTFTNISNTGGYTGVTDFTDWSACTMGDIAVLNNPNGYPEYWTGSSTIQDLDFDGSFTWRTKNYRCKFMRTARNFLIAFGTTEGGVYYPTRIRWSDIADSGSLPTTWDETVATNLAGVNDLAGEDGAIIDALPLRNGLAVYLESGIYQMEYIGGTYVWSFRRLPVNVGALATNCVVPVLNGHVLLSEGDVLFNDGTNVKSIIHKRLKEKLIATINADNYENSFVTAHRQNKEVWICVPSISATYPDTAFIWNYQDDTWSVRDLPEVTSMGYGVKAETGAVQWSDLTATTWEDDSGIWGQRNFTPLNDALVATLPNASTPKTVVIDPITSNDGDSFTTVLERTNFDISGHGNVATITRVIPHISGTKPVTMQIGAHDYAGSPVRWKASGTFTPEVDRKLDVRSTGELHAFRLESTDPNFTLSGLTIEYELSGTR